MFIDSYVLSANNKKIGTTWVNIKADKNVTISGLKVDVVWIVTAEFAGPFPHSVTTRPNATYDFN